MSDVCAVRQCECVVRIRNRRSVPTYARSPAWRSRKSYTRYIVFIVYIQAAAAVDRTRWTWTAPSILLQVAEHGDIEGPCDGRHGIATDNVTTYPVSALHGSDDRDGRVGRGGGPAACAEGFRPRKLSRQRGHRSRRGCAPAVRHHRRRAVRRRV